MSQRLVPENVPLKSLGFPQDLEQSPSLPSHSHLEGQSSLIISRKHVLFDLKPYVCTFENCELKLFSDRRTWFSHELKDHRQVWGCCFCSHDSFDDADKYKRHLASCHPESLVEDQLPALLKMSQTALVKLVPTDCPLCDDWEQCLRRVAPHVPSAEAFVVTPSQFQHHLGTHMEQLALFAIPRRYNEEGGADSGIAAAQVNFSASSLENSEVNSTSAWQLRLCEEIMSQLSEFTEQSDLSYLSEPTIIPLFYLWIPKRGRVKVPPLSIPNIVQNLASGEYQEADDLFMDMKVFFALLDLTHEAGAHDKICSLVDRLWEDKIGTTHTDSLSQWLKQEIGWKLWSATEMTKEQVDRPPSTITITMTMLDGERLHRNFDKLPAWNICTCLQTAMS